MPCNLFNNNIEQGDSNELAYSAVIMSGGGGLFDVFEPGILWYIYLIKWMNEWMFKRKDSCTLMFINVHVVRFF